MQQRLISLTQQNRLSISLPVIIPDRKHYPLQHPIRTLPFTTPQQVLILQLLIPFIPAQLPFQPPKLFAPHVSLPLPLFRRALQKVILISSELLCTPSQHFPFTEI